MKAGKRNSNTGGSLGAFALGAATSFFMDAQRGTRRRALLRQKSGHLARVAREGMQVASLDLINRSRGVVARGRSRLSREEVIDDVLVERVRSRLGRLVSHPHAIDVFAQDGTVILKGLILADELEPLLAQTRRIRGVHDIVSELRVHESNEKIPALQGGIHRRGIKPDIFQSRWAPATRLLVALCGSVAITFGTARRDLRGLLFSSSGMLMALRSLLNRELKSVAASGRAKFIRINKTVNIDAPVPQVFQFWANFQNFPRFMKSVREVRLTEGSRRSHWVVDGPAGTPIAWDAVTTRVVPNEQISWRSLPGSVIPNAGRVCFRPNEKGGTRIELSFTYHPPGGALGHVAATLFGSGPKGKLEEAMAQMKTLIEEGPSRRQIFGAMHG